MSRLGKQILGLFILMGLLLSACNREKSITNTATPIPLAQQSTATTTTRPTLTATQKPTATNTPKPVITPTLKPTNTPTVEPTQPPTPDPNPFPEVPVTSFVEADYQLHPPDPDLFLDTLNKGMLYNFYAIGNTKPNQYDADLRREGINAFFQFLTADLNTYYPDGLPNAAYIFENESIASDLPTSFLPTPLYKIIHTVLFEYIQQEGFQSTDDFDFTLYPINLNEALEPTWLVKIYIPRYGLIDWIPYHLTEAGEYQEIDNDLFSTFVDNSPQVELSHDLTGDDIPEILLITQNYLGAGRSGGFVSVNAWDGDRISRLEFINYSAQISRGTVEQEIGDFDGDGREEIRIIQHHYANFDCTWDEIATYQWQGVEPHHITTGSEFPDTPLCDGARALDFRSQLSTIERIDLLENVLLELSIETAPSIDYLALLRVRLAALYTMEGNDADARRVLTEIETLPSEAKFIQFFNTHVDLASDSPVTICDSLYAAIGPPLSPVLGTDIDKYIAIAAFGAYPLDSSPVPDAVCPLSLLISEKLGSVQIPNENDLVLSFANIDLPYLSLLEANLDSDPALEQIGLIDLSEQTLVIMDAVDGQWEPSIIKDFGSSISEIQHEFRNVTDNNLPEILLLVSLESECGGVKDTAKQERWLLVIEQIDNQFGLKQDQWICENVVDLSTLDTTEDELIPPFWEGMAGDFPWTGIYLVDDNNFYDYLNTLTAEVINQEKPFEETLLSLETLMNSLPDDNPLSDIIRPRLLFTLGYHYELNDDETNAVETYLELINIAPSSPWSWLAWMRLETAENVN